MQKREDLTEDDLKTTFTVQQTLVTFLVVLVFILLPFAQKILKFGDDGLWLGRALAFSLLLASLKSIPSVLLERKLKFKQLIIPEIVESLVFNGVLVGSAVMGMGIRSFTYAVLARGLAGLISIYIISPWRVSFGYKREVASRLVRFGLPFQINSILAWFKDNLMDNVVALLLHSPVAFGYLSWAKNLAYQPRKVMDSVIRVSFPAFSRLQDRRDTLSRALSKTYFLLSVTMFPLIAGICMLVKPLIVYLYGGDKWLPAIPSVYFFSGALLWGLFNSVAINTLSAIGKIKTVLKFMTMVTVATWVVTPPLTLLMGFNGASLSLVLTGFVSLWSIRKCVEEVKVNIWQEIKGALMASVVMSLLLFVANQYYIHDLTRLFITIAAGGLTYTAAIFLIEGKRLVQEVKSVLGK